MSLQIILLTSPHVTLMLPSCYPHVTLLLPSWEGLGVGWVRGGLG
ncbi:TRAP-type C4-dicarboxylate transport system,large permease component [Crocosphaera watsonii WH 0401]|uniref:TRAP-type C4-dicarboxylate transport system,large permease component n=1 Tax=Crocosphaera watsonii WH 0401 TaxID=555881 RepID=T2J3S8_CROWT|nr:TRAP-type C4-dicarboxylate transport system,large permease component [Crocosphaera watsonii WH 0401]